MDAQPFHLIRMCSVRSTQEEARRLVSEGCRSSTILLAEEQTAGRGRGDRSWHSLKGLGIWMTLVHRSVRPASEWPALTSVAALAICRALEDLSLQPRIKWPNDILLPGGKVAGVLAETAGEVVLLGIGINILHESSDFSDELRGTATSVRMELAGSRRTDVVGVDTMLERLLPQLEDVLGVNERAGTSAWLPDVWERSIVRDLLVTVERTSGDPVSGIAVGLGPIGELLLKTDHGTLSVANGTLTHLEDR